MPRELCKFDMGLSVVCIEEYETLKLDCHYQISGMGDLSSNHATDKKGYGFCVKQEFYFMDNDLGHNRSKKIDYYFTESEMYKYFITDEEYRLIHDRDQKLKEMGI